MAQFRLTQGVAALYWPTRSGTPCSPTAGRSALRQQALRWIVNVLEDQRIEKAICIYYPGVTPAIRLLGDLTYTGQSSLGRLPPAEQALGCCLAWRWAHSRTGEADMHDRLNVSVAG